MNFPPPNYTSLPNYIIDEAMLHMKQCTLKVVLVIIRKTVGWHKQMDRISLSQFEQLTGLQRHAVLDGIDEALSMLVIKRELNEGCTDFSYGLNADWYEEGGSVKFTPPQCEIPTPPKPKGGGGGSVKFPPTKETSNLGKKHVHVHAPPLGKTKEEIGLGPLKERKELLESIVFPNGTRVSQRNIETWTRMYPLWKMKKVCSAIKRKLEFGGDLTNPEGLMFTLLKNPDMDTTPEIEEARTAAEEYIESIQAPWIVIDSYVVYGEFNKEIPLLIGKERVLEEMRRWIDVR